MLSKKIEAHMGQRPQLFIIRVILFFLNDTLQLRESHLRALGK